MAKPHHSERYSYDGDMPGYDDAQKAAQLDARLKSMGNTRNRLFFGAIPVVLVGGGIGAFTLSASSEPNFLLAGLVIAVGIAMFVAHFAVNSAMGPVQRQWESLTGRRRGE